MATNPNVRMTADEAVRARGYDRATPFICPYPDCGVFAQHHWGQVASVTVPLSETKATSRLAADDPLLILAVCEACSREVVYADAAVIWPTLSTAPGANIDMPDEVRADFNEARLIFHSSPRGAAALLRLALQKLLPHIGADGGNINDGIAGLVRQGTVPQRVQQALDALRVVGNEAVHPGELDLRDDATTVLVLFNLLNFIVEKTISDPKQVDGIYGMLPAGKLKGIADRDAPKP